MSGSMEERKLASHLSVIPANVIRAAELESQILSESAPKIAAFIRYLRLEDQERLDTCLGRMGKSPDCLGLRPEGGPSAVLFGPIDANARAPALLSNTKAAQYNAKKLSAAEKLLESMSPATVLEQVHAVFDMYCDKALFVAEGRRAIAAVGFLRMLRDASLLDNQLTAVQAATLFRAGAGAGKKAQQANAAHQDYPQFLACLKRVARLRYPPSTPLLTPAELSSYETRSLLQISKLLLAPMVNKVEVEVKPIDALYTPELLELQRTYDTQLLRVFAWYATLDEKDRQRRVAWEFVRQEGLTVGRSELMLMMMNFQVLPLLMSKQEALDVFVKQRPQGHATTRSAGLLSQPMAMESLAALAVHLADSVVKRLRGGGLSSEDMRSLQKYADCCQGSLRNLIEDLIDKRTSKFLALKNTHNQVDDVDSLADSPYASQVLTMRSNVAAKEEQKITNKRLAVLARREEQRTKLALTRLKNYYRDVRTDPPDRGGGSKGAGHRAFSVGASPGGMTGEEWGGVDEEVPVEFFDGSRQIKTPKAHSRPTILAAPTSPPPGPDQIHPNEMRGYGGAADVMYSPHGTKIHSTQVLEAAQNMDPTDLLEFVSFFIHGDSSHSDASDSWGASVTQRIAHSAAKMSATLPHRRSSSSSAQPHPHPYLQQQQQQMSHPSHPMLSSNTTWAPIEQRDESEAIMEWAKRLPSINLPPRLATSAPSSLTLDVEGRSGSVKRGDQSVSGSVKREGQGGSRQGSSQGCKLPSVGRVSPEPKCA